MTAQNDFRIGQKLFLDENYLKSIDAFSSALEHGLEPDKGYLALGMAHLRNGDFPEAIEDFSHVMEFTKDHKHALLYRAIARLNYEQLQEAIDDLTQVLDRQPDRTEALVARGLALKELQRNKEAEQDLQKALCLSGIEVEEFMRKFALCPAVIKSALSLLDIQHEPWAQRLAEKQKSPWKNPWH